MDPGIFAALLGAAAMHAVWNSMVKAGRDRLVSMTANSLGSGTIALALIIAIAPPLPQARVWPWLAASSLLHTGYRLVLTRAYRAGDFGQVYPIARGTAPLLVAGIGYFVLAEAIGWVAAAGIAALTLGVWLMSVRGGRDTFDLDRASVAFALLTACFIASYTVVDGLGARAASSVVSYALCLFLLDTLLMVGATLAIRGRQTVRPIAAEMRHGLVGGALAVAAYGIALWAMTKVPLAMVAALRETSVLFALLISAAVLREPPTAWRTAAGLMIVAGAVGLRLA